MNNSKRSEPRDRLSELPNSVIFDIFSPLPVTDLARTTVLSKRWRNLWTATPFLNFSDSYSGNRVQHPDLNDYSDRVRNFLNQALLRWNGGRILKFKLDFCYELKKSVYRDIDSWVGFAVRNEVEEFYLHLQHHDIPLQIGWNFDSKEGLYWVPQSLYSCSSLKELSFKNCKFGIDGNVQWNQLKKLRIEGLGVTSLVVNQILSGSPLLQVLILSFAEAYENYCIRSSSLKELSICKRLYVPVYFHFLTELSIWAPNLETLEIRGLPFSKHLMMDISSLTRVTLGIFGLHYFGDDDESLEDDQDFLGHVFSQELMVDKFCLALPTIQHVENIALMYCCVKVLGLMKEKCAVSSFPNVKCLQIGYRVNDHELLVECLLDVFPQLKTLILLDREEFGAHDGRESLDFDIKNFHKFEANLPESFRLELRTVEVTWSMGDNIFPFIKFVLKYASKLEKIVFRVRLMEPHGQSGALFFASQKLLKMPRSSPSAELIFCAIPPHQTNTTSVPGSQSFSDVEAGSSSVRQRFSHDVHSAAMDSAVSVCCDMVCAGLISNDEFEVIGEYINDPNGVVLMCILNLENKTMIEKARLVREYLL